MAAETKVKLSTIFSILGAVGALLAIGGYLFSFGERMGRMEQSITRLETAQAKATGSLDTVKDTAKADVLMLAKSARVRLREHEAIMHGLSESIIALTTEVRVRDGDRSYVHRRTPMKAQEAKAEAAVDSKLRKLKLAPASDDPLAGLEL